MKEQYSMLVAKMPVNHIYTNDWDAPPGGLIIEETQYIDWLQFTIYGAPSGTTDTQLDEIQTGDDENLIPLASFYGCMIMCEQMINDDIEPYSLCDDSSADLGYAISALQEPGAPLNGDNSYGNPWSNVIYIHEIEAIDNNMDEDVFQRIIDELPFIMWSFTNIKAEILAYFPSPTERDWKSPEEQHRQREISRIIVDRISASLPSYIDSDVSKGQLAEQSESNVTRLPVDYQLDDDDIRLHMGQRIPGSEGYPKEFKNTELIKQYTDCGFREAAESRLLYKYTDLSINDEDDYPGR